MTASTVITTIGTVAGSGKVHIALGQPACQHITCRFGPAKLATTTTLAECPDGDDICDILLAAEVKISRLCKSCFSIRLRVRYQAHIRQALADAT
jgi:hypothetical protein